MQTNTPLQQQLFLVKVQSVTSLKFLVIQSGWPCQLGHMIATLTDMHFTKIKNNDYRILVEIA